MKSGVACEFCKRVFSDERRLINHVCERKRRYLQRDDKTTKYGYMVYEHWFRRTMRQVKSIEDFETSNYYTAFVRFARYLLDLNAINPLGFVDFLARFEVPLDRWTDPGYYGTYIRETNKNESPREAIGRNVMLINEWSIDTGQDWRDFFRLVSPARATQWIIGGRISPWLLLIASSASALLARLSGEQMAMIEAAIDSQYWKARLARHQSEVDELRIILQEYNI
jgi:hypothetical protein